MSVYGPDYHFHYNGWTLADVTSFGGLRMEIGVLYLSHAMLILVELIVVLNEGVCMHPS